MKTKPSAIILLCTFGLVSCVAPTGTPEQQARQTEANAKVANAIALGITSAVLDAAVNRGPRGFAPMFPRAPRAPFFP